MATALNIIERALLDLTVLGDGEVASSQQSKDGLIYLNDLIQSWDNEGLLVNSITQDTLTMTGALTYTMGTGGTFNVERPTSVLSGFFTLNSVDYPMDIINREQYNSIADKSVTSSIPNRMYIEYAYPLAVISIFPVVSSGTLTLSSIKPLVEPATINTVLSMPKGYERALRLNLAVEMMSQYGMQNQLIMQMADKAKKDIKRVNSSNRPIVSGLGLPAGGRSMSDVYRGWNGRT